MPTNSGNWTFDNTVNDATAAHNGTYFTSPGTTGTAAYATGLLNNAINLDGANDYVSFPYNTGLTAYTISTWVKTPETLSPANIIARTINDDPLNSATDQIEINQIGTDQANQPIYGFVSYLYDPGISGKSLSGTTILQPNTWYHVAIEAANSGMMRLFVNGTEDTTARFVSQIYAPFDQFHIGDAAFNTKPNKIHPGPLDNFNGLIDDLRIYNQVLASQDIKTLYSTGIPIVAVQATDTTATEGTSDNGVFTFTRFGNISGDVVVNYSVEIGGRNATQEADYNLLSDTTTLTSSVTIPNGSSTISITVVPIDDSQVEGDETVTLSLIAGSGYGLDTSTTATVTIIDDDSLPTVSIYVDDPDAYEQDSDPGVFKITRDGTGPDLTVLYNTNSGQSGAATNGGGQPDYTLSGTVTISSGASFAYITITPVDDSIGEPDEQATLTIIPITPTPTYNIGASPSATVTIHDNEPVVSITTSDPDATEGSDIGTLTISRTGSTSSDLTVNYNTNSGSGGDSATLEADYLLLNGSTTLAGSVVIPAGTSSVVVTVSTIEDSTTEGDETAILTLPSGTGYYVDPSNNTGTVTIHDSDQVVSISTTVSPANEGGTTGALTISRTGSTSSDLTVNYNTNSGSGGDSATLEADYLLLNGSTTLAGSVVIPAGTSSVVVTVSPIDDTVAESDENVIVTLSSGTGYALSGSITATVTLQDNEPIVNVSATDNEATEGADTATFKITRNITGAALVVIYQMTGSAINGGENGDYTSLDGTATISSGSTSVDVVVTTIDDSVAEPDETAILTIQPVTPNPTYHIGTSPSAIVTIHDNEPTVNITTADGTAAELGQDAGVFTVNRVGSTSGNLVVYYSTNSGQAGAATNGTDYTPSLSGTVTISAGSSSVNITITPEDDELVEGNETVMLTISSVSPNPTYYIGTQNASFTIVDNDFQATGALLQFENNLNDSFGSHNGTAYGSPGYGTGKLGQALVLHSSTSDYVNIPYTSANSITAYTIAGWINPTTVANSDIVVLTDSSGPNATPSHQIRINNGKFEHSTFDPSVPGLKVVTGTSTIQSNTWYHVAIVASAGGKMHLYVNGVEEGNPVDITNLFAGGDRFHIGDPSNSGAFGYFNGLVDDLHIYEQALSAADIRSLFEDVPPEALWQFDGSVNDSIGTNNGTFYDGANPGTASYLAGKVGNALDLDGSNDYVNIPYDASSVTAYTISGWVKPTDTSNVNIFVLTNNLGPVVTPSHQIRINSAGEFEHSTYDQGAGSMKVVTGTTTVQANTWYHVAIVAKAGDTMRLYVNGVEENSLGLNNPVSVNGLFSGGDRFQIGVAAYGGPGVTTGYFDGLVDDMSFYRQALSPADIKAIYQKNLPQTELTLDSNVNDSIGLHNGTLISTQQNYVPSYVPGIIGNALTFDGSNYINIPYTSASSLTAYTMLAGLTPPR